MRVRVDGPRRIYRFDPAPLAALDLWLAPFRAFWAGRLDALGDYLQLSDCHGRSRRLQRNGDAVDLSYARHFPRSVETVWAALTDPARLAGLVCRRTEPPSTERWRDMPSVCVGRYRLEGVILEPPLGHCG